MGQAAESPRMTLEEYVEFEMGAAQKHEFINGEVYAMTGGTSEHARIQINLARALFKRLPSHCIPTNADQRVYIDATQANVYPDLTVVCGPHQWAHHDKHALTNPKVVFEVLSPSTAGYDRGPKFDHYRRLPSLQTYVVVHQDQPLVLVHERQADGAWLFRDHGQGEVPLPALGVELPLVEIYDFTNLRPEG